MQKKQSRFTLLLLGICGVAAVVLALGLFGLQQFMAHAASYDRQRSAYAKEGEHIRRELETMEEKEQELAGLETELNALDQNLTDYSYIPTYLKQMQTTARETGNTVRSIRPRPMERLNSSSPLIKASQAKRDAKDPQHAKKTAGETQAGKAKKDDKQDDEGKAQYFIQQITLEVDGNYVSLMRFLSALKNFPKLVYVHSMSITPGRTEDGTLTARLETYAVIIPEQYKAPQKSAKAAAEGDQP